MACSKNGRRLEAQGDLQGAARTYRKAQALAPDDCKVLNRLGVVACRAGLLDKALDLIRRAICMDPECGAYHNSLGNVYKRKGRLSEAESSLLRAVSLSPESAEARYDLGIVYQISGRLEKAMASYRSAVDCDANQAQAWNNMGLIYIEQNERDKAVACFETATVRKADFTSAYNNLGSLYKAENDFRRAARCYEKSLSIDSRQPAVFTLLGNTYQLMQMPTDAMNYYRQAVDAQPEIADHWVNLGTSYHDLNDFQKTIECYKKALAINPKLPQAFLNLGVVFKELGRNTEALAFFEEAFRLDPTCGTALNHLVVHLHYQCDWKRLEHCGKRLDEMTRDLLAKTEVPFEDPFLNLIRHDAPELNFRVANAWSAQIEKRCHQRFNHRPTHTRSRRKIRIGYLSNNFRNHPGADLILGILDHYDRSSFKVYCYSWGEDDQSSQRKRIVHACDHFVDISRLDDHQAAKRIHADGIDILVDLLGYLKHSRLAICAYRPAPTQVRFLGFVGTTGADFFDYMISDAVVTPAAHQQYFSEKLILMPDCYLVNNYAKDDSRRYRTEKTRNGGDPFVFCCFNTSYKLDPVIFAVWMDILLQVPGSVLWLMPESSMVKKNLAQTAREHGVEESRLIFKNKVSRMEHLNRLEHCDLAFDTLNINGVASTSDALWAGLPVVTLLGRHFASRISASLLHAMGLNDLIAKSLDDYATVAIDLAQNPIELERMRRIIDKNRISGALFNTEKFVRGLEEAYRRIRDQYADGKPAETITLFSEL